MYIYIFLFVLTAASARPYRRSYMYIHRRGDTGRRAADTTGSKQSCCLLKGPFLLTLGLTHRYHCPSVMSGCSTSAVAAVAAEGDRRRHLRPHLRKGFKWRHASICADRHMVANTDLYVHIHITERDQETKNYREKRELASM